MARRIGENEIQLRVRIMEPLRAQLDSEADRNGRSLNSEIIDRLRRSLDAERFGGPDRDETAADLAVIIEHVISDIGPQAGSFSTHSSKGAKTWIDNSYAYEQVCRAVSKILDAFRPAGPTSIQEFAPGLIASFDRPGDSKSQRITAFDNLGEAFAKAILSEINNANSSPTKSPGLPPWIVQARRLQERQSRKERTVAEQGSK
jgi:hypothetical protein